MGALRLIIPASLVFAAYPATAKDGDVVPRVGRDGPEMDACGGIGQVFALGPSERARLAVREFPDDYARKKDELPARTLIWLCDTDESGDFQGVVYPKGDFQDLGDCKVSSPIAVPEPYSGPCQYGWVRAQNIQLVAG